MSYPIRESFMTFLSLQWFYKVLCSIALVIERLIAILPCISFISRLCLRFQIRRARPWCHLFWLKIVFALRDTCFQSYWKKQSITSRGAWGNSGITVSLFLLRRDYLLCSTCYCHEIRNTRKNGVTLTTKPGKSNL